MILDMGGKDEPLDKDLLANIDVISPNQTELGRILGTDAGALESDAEAENCIQRIMEENPNLDVLYKMGSRGSSYYERKGDYMDQEMQKGE